MSLPRVGISRCLLGDPVRYDGGHKHEPSLTDSLGGQVEWVPVCPELEVGMGVPREPIHLVSEGTGGVLRLIGVTSGDDWTERMARWALTRLHELAALPISGFVLKSRSPSCGLGDVPIRGLGPGRGMFAQLLVEQLPALPVEEEDGLRDPAAREAFLAHVRTYQRTRA